MSKKESKEYQYIVSYPRLGSNPPFGSDRDPGVTINQQGSQRMSTTKLFHNFLL